MLRQNAKEGKKMGGTTTATVAELLHDCFHLNVTGLSFFPPPPIIRGTHQSCTCARSAPALVAALSLGCFVKDPA